MVVRTPAGLRGEVRADLAGDVAVPLLIADSPICCQDDPAALE
jgi:hypothetical protein